VANRHKPCVAMPTVYLNSKLAIMQPCSKKKVSQSWGLWQYHETKIINSVRGLSEGARIQIHLLLCLEGSLRAALLSLQDIWDGFLHGLYLPVSCVWR